MVSVKNVKNKIMKNKEYKVEMKGSLWSVVLRSGSYSYRQESHFVFSGNSKEEVWEFLKRYIDDVANKNSYVWGLENGVCLAIVDEENHENKYLSTKYIGGGAEFLDWSDIDSVADVKIERLNVIYFNK